MVFVKGGQIQQGSNPNPNPVKPSNPNPPFRKSSNPNPNPPLLEMIKSTFKKVQIQIHGFEHFHVKSKSKSGWIRKIGQIRI